MACDHPKKNEKHRPAAAGCYPVPMRILPAVAVLSATLAAALAACQAPQGPQGQSSVRPATPAECLALQPRARGLVTLRETPVALLGVRPAVGAKAPDARVVGADLKDVNLASFRGKTVVLITVPSLDTPVCQKETRVFHEHLAGLPNVAGVVVSMDLPQAQKRFCAAEGIKTLAVLSDFRHWEAGLAYGVRMENGLLARSVWVIRPDGTIAYRELVKDVAGEPDYDAALAAAAGK